MKGFENSTDRDRAYDQEALAYHAGDITKLAVIKRYIESHGFTARANAELMASAPRLLSALEAIQEAGRISDEPRARYCAEIARGALEEA